MTNHDSLLKAMAEITSLALDEHSVTVNVHGISRADFLAFRDRYDVEPHMLGSDTVAVTATVFGDFYPNVEVTYFLEKGVSLVDETGPLVADEESEDPRDERFDREAGFYEGWKGPGEAA